MKSTNRIVWGEDERKVPRHKKFIHEVDTQVSKSIILDYTDGEKELTHLAGKSRSFPNPKPTTLIERFILQTADHSEWIMDFFAGSGTTFHAANSARHDDRQRRRVLLIEGGPHFEPVLMARVKRVSSAWQWKNGKPLALNGPGLFLCVQTLEQYEDTLENLAQEDGGDKHDYIFDDPAFQLRYRLDRQTRRLYAGIDRFTSPFGYQLQRVQGGEAVSSPVDMLESVVYLLGLDVNRLYREPQGVVLTGHNRRGLSVLVLFRELGGLSKPDSSVGGLSKPDSTVGGLSKPDSSRLGNRSHGELSQAENCSHDESAAWLQAKLAEHPADRRYTNDPAALVFEGSETFEAIEAVFALQFGRE